MDNSFARLVCVQYGGQLQLAKICSRKCQINEATLYVVAINILLHKVVDIGTI